MDKDEFYKILAKDPYKAHKAIIASGNLKGLLAWIRSMAIKHNLTLWLNPIYPREVAKWKVIAKMYLGELIDNSNIIASGVKWNPREIQGLFEMCTHFRNAHVCRCGNNKEYIRGGSIVRADKLDKISYTALTGIKGQYNAAMRKRAKDGNIEFISLIDWVKSHPDVYDIWQRSIQKREDLVTAE